MKTDRRALKNHLAVRSSLAADLQLVFNYACIHVQTDTHTHARIGTVYTEVSQGIRDLLLTSDISFILHVNWLLKCVM